ncbi:hypothetical protein [Pseudarthrobacter oxydans]|uniref:hypothetical protein n=1 Tax=Pseudarthrobacter oxydans TaxID=1671 RepID=UPI0035E9225D
MTEDRRTSIRLGSWMSLVAVVLVMAPSAYRAFSGTSHWGDAAMLVTGAGLAAFHVVRLIRLGQAPTGPRTYRGDAQQ